MLLFYLGTVSALVAESFGVDAALVLLGQLSVQSVLLLCLAWFLVHQDLPHFLNLKLPLSIVHTVNSPARQWRSSYYILLLYEHHSLKQPHSMLPTIYLFFFWAPFC